MLKLFVPLKLHLEILQVTKVTCSLRFWLIQRYVPSFFIITIFEPIKCQLKFTECMLSWAWYLAYFEKSRTSALCWRIKIKILILILFPIVIVGDNILANIAQKISHGGQICWDTKWYMANFGGFLAKTATRFSLTPAIYKDTYVPIMLVPGAMPVLNAEKHLQLHPD